MPPDKEDDFCRELELETRTISISSYHIEPVDLRELKSQLKELLERDFICPSISLWGEPVLFVKKNGSMRCTLSNTSWRR